MLRAIGAHIPASKHVVHCCQVVVLHCSHQKAAIVGDQKWGGCLHSCRPQESGDKTSKLAKLPQLAKLLLKLLLWLLLLCYSLLRLLVLLRRRYVSQELRELLSLHGTQERSQVGKDTRKPVCIRGGLVSFVVGLSGSCWFARFSALGLLGLRNLLSLRLLLSWLCVLGFSWHGLGRGCWRSRSHSLASVQPGLATKEIGKHLDVWVAQNRVDLSCKMALWGNSLARSRQPDHLVVRMETSSLTSCTHVVVRADKALVSRSNHWTVAAIADDAPMNLGTPCHSRVAFILCFVPQLHLELVNRSSQGSQGNLELLVRCNRDLVSILICPAENRIAPPELREDGGDLLLEVDQAARHLLVHLEPPRLLLLSLAECHLEGN